MSKRKVFSFLHMHHAFLLSYKQTSITDTKILHEKHHAQHQYCTQHSARLLHKSSTCGLPSNNCIICKVSCSLRDVHTESVLSSQNSVLHMHHAFLLSYKQTSITDTKILHEKHHAQHQYCTQHSARLLHKSSTCGLPSNNCIICKVSCFLRDVHTESVLSSQNSVSSCKMRP